MAISLPSGAVAPGTVVRYKRSLFRSCATDCIATTTATAATVVAAVVVAAVVVAAVVVAACIGLSHFTSSLRYLFDSLACLSTYSYTKISFLEN